LIITPFQIFCYQNRERLVRANPHLRGIDVTSLLGRMWRALSQSSRDHYVDLSLKLRGYPRAKFASIMGSLGNSCDFSQPITFDEVFAVPLSLERIGTVQHRRFDQVEVAP
jgi:hypothetical protein